MADRMQLRVVTYDIADDRRRRRIAALLEDQAARVQESVFEIRLTNRASETLMRRLRALAAEGDNLRLYTIPDTALRRCDTEGGPAIAGGARYWLL
jgi:CRISPR-associated protein Cas2